MPSKYHLEDLLSATSEAKADHLALFAFINLGLIESLSNGILSATEAVNQLYFADNCLFVRKTLRNKLADQVMGRGVQLPDLFDCLPTRQAQREFLHELATMRSLCLQILDSGRKVA